MLAYYTYDSAERLTHEVSGGKHTYYSYDRNGSCTLIEKPDDAEYTYFEYNDARLLKAAHVLPEDRWDYFHYDGQLARYCIEDSAGCKYYYWDGLDLLARTNLTTGESRSFVQGQTPIPGIGNMVDYTQDGATHTFHYDHRGTVFGITDGSQDVAQTYEHDAWGVRLSSVGSLENPIQYQGCAWLTSADVDGVYVTPMRSYLATIGRFAEKDKVRRVARSGDVAKRHVLAFHRMHRQIMFVEYEPRYYSIYFDRFVSRDPVGFRVGRSTYAYANSGPPRWVDPLGLAGQDTWFLPLQPDDPFGLRLGAGYAPAPSLVTGRPRQPGDDVRSELLSTLFGEDPYRLGRWSGHMGPLFDADAGHSGWQAGGLWLRDVSPDGLLQGLLAKAPAHDCPVEEENLKSHIRPEDCQWCVDWGNPFHGEATCYRQVSSTLWGAQCCYSNGLLVESSPDWVSPAAGCEPCGKCVFPVPRVAGHFVADVAPYAVAAGGDYLIQHTYIGGVYPGPISDWADRPLQDDWTSGGGRQPFLGIVIIIPFGQGSPGR